MIERDASGNPIRLHLSAGAKRVPSKEADDLVAKWFEQHERKLMIVAVGAREAMIESLVVAIDAALDKAKVRGYEIGLMDGSLDCVDGTQIIERQGPRGRVEPTSNDGRERSQ